MLAIGDILGGTYRVERLIGQGGTACVYEVSHVRLPRRFAVKVMTGQAFSDAVFMQRFRQEAEILGSLEHPHLVQVLEWNFHPAGYPYLVMELLPGEDLGKFITRVGALSHPIAISIFLQIAEALQYLHEQGVVHRDLKPGNIFLCRNGPFPNYVKVLDFGIAKAERSAIPIQTDRAVLMGTPAYMAPEQARGLPHLVDARTDQFALAAILYEMLAGRAAFYRPDDDMMTTLVRVATEEPPALGDSPLERAMMRALSKDRDTRFASIADFVNATGLLRTEGESLVAGRTERIPDSVILRATQLSSTSVTQDRAMSKTLQASVQDRSDAPSQLQSYTGARGAEAYAVPRQSRGGSLLRGAVLGVALLMGVVGVSVWSPWLPGGGHWQNGARDLAVPSDASVPPAVAERKATVADPRRADGGAGRGGGVAEPRAEGPQGKGGAGQPSDGDGPVIPPEGNAVLGLNRRPEGGKGKSDVGGGGAGPKGREPSGHEDKGAGGGGGGSRRGSRRSAVQKILGAADPERAAFIRRCAEEVARDMPKQVHRMSLTISRCDPVCVGVANRSSPVDREVRLTLQHCLKQYRGVLLPGGVVWISFY